MILIPQHGSSRQYKTMICRHFEIGNCSIGDRCQFAHGMDELRKPSDPLPQIVPQIDSNLVITNFKSNKVKGFCKNGQNCCYAHGAYDRKETQISKLKQDESKLLTKSITQQNEIIDNDVKLDQLLKYFIEEIEVQILTNDKKMKELIQRAKSQLVNQKFKECTQTIAEYITAASYSDKNKNIYRTIYQRALEKYQQEKYDQIL